MFICLPDALCVQIAKDYLKIKEISRMDTAICNHKQRSDWLSVLSSAGYICISFTEYLDVSMTHWIKMKNIKLSSLNLRTEISKRNRKVSSDPSHILSLNLSQVTSIYFENYRMETFTLEYIKNLCAKCPHLKQLWLISISCKPFDVIAALSLEQLSQFTSLYASDCEDDDTERILPFLVSYCPSITKLVSVGEFTKVNVSDFMSLMTKCPHLNDVFLPMEDSDDSSLLKVSFKTDVRTNSQALQLAWNKNTQLDGKKISDVVHLLTHIISLDAIYITGNFGCFKAFAVVVDAILQYHPKMARLRIDGVYSTTSMCLLDTVMMYLVKLAKFHTPHHIVVLAYFDTMMKLTWHPDNLFTLEREDNSSSQSLMDILTEKTRIYQPTDSSIQIAIEIGSMYSHVVLTVFRQF